MSIEELSFTKYLAQAVHQKLDRNKTHMQPFVHTKEDLEHHLEVSKNASMPQNRAVDEYKDESGQFNRPLRLGIKPTTQIQEMTKHLRNVTKNQIPHEFHGYRAFSNRDISKLKKGDTIHQKGFTGISHSYDQAHSFAKSYDKAHKDDETWVARIHAPAKTKGFHPISKRGDLSFVTKKQKETILHPGTSFKVTDHSVHYSEDKDGTMQAHHIVHMKIHSQKD